MKSDLIVPLGLINEPTPARTTTLSSLSFQEITFCSILLPLVSPYLLLFFSLVCMPPLPTSISSLSSNFLFSAPFNSSLYGYLFPFFPLLSSVSQFFLPTLLFLSFPGQFFLSAPPLFSFSGLSSYQILHHISIWSFLPACSFSLAISCQLFQPALPVSPVSGLLFPTAPLLSSVSAWSIVPVFSISLISLWSVLPLIPVPLLSINSNLFSHHLWSVLTTCLSSQFLLLNHFSSLALN